MDGCQVGVLKQANQVGLSGLLQGQDGTALKAQVRLEVLGNLTNQALEGQLPAGRLTGSAVDSLVWLADSRRTWVSTEKVHQAGQVSLT